MATSLGKQRYIYLVDDDSEDRELFSEALSKVSETVVLAEFQSGEKLIETLKNHSIPKPEVIFLDVNMPKFNGLEILRLLKSSPEFKHFKVVMLSTYSHDNYIEEAYRYGASSYYVKPTRFENLMKIIGNALTPIRKAALNRKDSFLINYAR